MKKCERDSSLPARFAGRKLKSANRSSMVSDAPGTRIAKKQITKPAPKWKWPIHDRVRVKLMPALLQGWQLLKERDFG